MRARKRWGAGVRGRGQKYVVARGEHTRDIFPLWLNNIHFLPKNPDNLLFPPLEFPIFF